MNIKGAKTARIGAWRVERLRVVRAAHNKITLDGKEERYLRAMRDANRETGAVIP